MGFFDFIFWVFWGGLFSVFTKHGGAAVRWLTVAVSRHVWDHVSVSLSPQRGASSGRKWRSGHQMWRVATNILNKQSRRVDKG